MPHCANTSDYLLAEAAPDDVALVEAGQRYTYRELRTAAGRLAAELAALDLPTGSRVGVLGPNSFFWVAAYLAVMKLNHVAVPFSDKLTPDDVPPQCGPRRVRRRLRGSACAAYARRSLRHERRGSYRPGSPVGPGALLAGRWLSRPGRRRRPDVHVGHDLPAESRTCDARQHPGEHGLDHHVPGTAQR